MSETAAQGYLPQNELTIQAMQRMPYYRHLVAEAKARGEMNISSTAIAEKLSLNPVLVRKDLAAVSTRHGKPKKGFFVDELLVDIERYMGCGEHKEAVIVGAGHLGRALMGNEEFGEYGIRITAGFDTDPKLAGTEINGIKILSAAELQDYCVGHGIKIAILTTPADNAQETADLLVEAGVSAIWNFALVMLKVPDGVLVRNENLASSLAVLSHHICV